MRGEGGCSSKPQPRWDSDRPLQACLNLSVSVFHPLRPCFSPLPRCACCHLTSPHLRLLLQTPFCPAISDTLPPPLSLPPPRRFLPLCQAAALSASFFPRRPSRAPSFQSVDFSPCPSDGPWSLLCFCSIIHPSTSALHSDSPFGSVRSANGIGCSLCSSRIQGAPGLPVSGGGDPRPRTTLRLEPDSDRPGRPVLGCCM